MLGPALANILGFSAFRRSEAAMTQPVSGRGDRMLGRSLLTLANVITDRRAGRVCAARRPDRAEGTV
jgi:hypothetical protein